MRSLFEETDERLQFAGHETFPLKYGWLKKAYDKVISCEPKDTRSIFSSEQAIAYFGVGKNMVVAIRHWSLTTGILAQQDDEAGFGCLRVSPLGEHIFQSDPYLEHPGSLWLLHWKLAAQPGRAATWHYAFNEFNEPIFTRDLLKQRLMRRCDELREGHRLKEARITEMTLKRDVECFMRTYVAKSSASGRAGSEEGGFECPLTELALIQTLDTYGGYQFRRGPKATLPDEVFVFGLVDFWRTYYPNRREFSLEGLTHEPGSPGRVFLLDDESVAERLGRLDEVTQGAICWDESTGLRQVYAPSLESVDPFALLARMYASNAPRKAAA